MQENFSNPTTPEEYLTPREAAIIAKSSPSTFAKYRCFGGGPKFIRVSSRKTLYRRSDLDQWLASRAQTSTSSEVI